MATYIVNGYTSVTFERDEEGHRDYHVSFRVGSDNTSPSDGPVAVLETPGLPTYGSIYILDNDIDEWAWCHWNTSVTPMLTDDKNQYWIITFLFSTKPPKYKYCQEAQIQDPLLIPPRISGGSNRYNEEATRDRFGRAVMNSAFERMHGPQVEFDHNRDTINIEINTPTLNLSLLTAIRDTVNDSPLWGLPARCIKLSNISWERKFQGTCEIYYTIKLTFETSVYVDPQTGVVSSGWDKHNLDEGTKSLALPNWPIDPTGNLYQGSGCTIAPGLDTGGDGIVTSAALNAGGFGYAPNSYIGLPLVDTTGQGSNAVVKVHVNAFGIVDSVISVLSGGSGYSPTSAYSTGVASGAVITANADSKNPADFLQFKDRAGENCTVLLNAGGCPISASEGTAANPGQHLIIVEYYRETDFLAIGIPTSF